MEAHWPLRLFFTGYRNDRVLFYRIAKQRGSSKNNSLGQQLLLSRPGITTILIGVRVYAGHMHSFRNARVDPHLRSSTPPRKTARRERTCSNNTPNSGESCTNTRRDTRKRHGLSLAGCRLECCCARSPVAAAALHLFRRTHSSTTHERRRASPPSERKGSCRRPSSRRVP